MEIVDANIVLRYLLKDHETLFLKSKQIIEQKQLYVPSEVIAEIVYVLEKVYEIPKSEISEGLNVFFNYPNITNDDIPSLIEALNVYRKENIDFVDALLVSYYRVHDHIIHTFDKKVKKLCGFEN